MLTRFLGQVKQRDERHLHLARDVNTSLLQRKTVMLSSSYGPIRFMVITRNFEEMTAI